MVGTKEGVPAHLDGLPWQDCLCLGPVGLCAGFTPCPPQPLLLEGRTELYLTKCLWVMVEGEGGECMGPR
jgi:hypothetical protein